MSYSSLNDAFNINSDFEKTIRGLNNFNPINNTMENVKMSKNSNGSLQEFNSNYQNNFYNPNDPLALIDGMYSGDDNLSWESLNGTDLYSGGDNISSSNKLTHRECIKIYNNPDNYKDSILSQALKHVSKCKMCKEEIKKSLITNTKTENNLKDTSSKSESRSTQKSMSNDLKNNNTNTNNNNNYKGNNIDNLTLLSNYKNFHNPSNSGSLNLSSQLQSQSQSNSKIESELKLLSDKINDENNLKYQNALIQNNISKYLEDLEERKKINNKLDNIIEVLRLEHNMRQDNDKIKSNSEFKENNLINLLSSPQFLLNLSKINDKNVITQDNVINKNNSTSSESYLLYLCIFVVILLLVIDIVLRINVKSD